MTILVTGGTGFIGSHTCVELLKNNYEIIILDSLCNSSIKVLKRIEKIMETESNAIKSKIAFHNCDLRDEISIRRIFKCQLEKNKPINSVIHFAGLKSVSQSFKDPFLYWENNVGGTINLIKVMKEFNCKKLVFSSSATVYEGKQIKRLTEQSKLNPSNPYGFTKLTIENFLKDLCSELGHDWRIVALRYFNPIGAHPSGLIGESPLGRPNNIFPLLCRVASGTYDKLQVFGNDWPTKDGTGIRDFIHVVDLAKAHMYAKNYVENGDKGISFLNVGTSIGTSVLELIHTFERVNECVINYEFVDRRNGDFPEIVADNKLLIKTLLWEPKLNLENMCKDGWNWQQKNPKGFN